MYSLQSLNFEMLTWLTVIVSCYYGYLTFSHDGSLKRFVLWILGAGYIFTCFELVQENEIMKFVNLQAEIPKECNPNDMSRLEYIFFQLGYNKDACLEYYRQNFKLVWLINPVTVLGHVLGLIAGIFGKAFGHFCSSILKELPWYAWGFLPIILIFAMMVLCIFLSFFMGRSFSFNLWHLRFSSIENTQQQFSDVEPETPRLESPSLLKPFEVGRHLNYPLKTTPSREISKKVEAKKTTKQETQAVKPTTREMQAKKAIKGETQAKKPTNDRVPAERLTKREMQAEKLKNKEEQEKPTKKPKQAEKLRNQEVQAKKFKNKEEQEKPTKKPMQAEKLKKVIVQAKKSKNKEEVKVTFLLEM